MPARFLGTTSVPYFLTGTLIAVAFFFNVQELSAQPSISIREKDAADAVAKLVLEERRQAHLSKLHRIEDPGLRADACERARQGNVRTWEGPSSHGKVGIISGVEYSTSDPRQPLPELLSFATRKEHWEAHRFGVGVCLLNTTTEASVRYWITIASYEGAFKSLLDHLWWD
jgi:hypothetical protein